MRVVLVAAGSAGDVNPFLAFGRVLRERGHDVVLFTSGIFEEAARAAGLRLVALVSREQFLEFTARPELWDPRRGFPFVMRETILPFLRAAIDRLRAEVEGRDAVMAASTLDLSARIVRDLLGTPLATVHVSPAPLRTLYRVPVFEGTGWIARAPRMLKRAFWRLSDALLDRHYVPELNAIRGELGLPPVRRPLHGWWNSPDRVLGLWPDWFAPVQPDFPPQLRLTGFPLDDGGGDRPLAGDLEGWFAAGEAPVLFTHGSANRQAAPFFARSLETVRVLGRRALFVTTRREDVPEELPDGVRWEPFVPFSRVLPRCVALVAHGGVGTMAQGLRAGLPQLVVPMAHDQHDNASRLVDLGAGAVLGLRSYGARAAAPLLRRLLDDARVRERAGECARRLGQEDGATAAAERIEGLARS